MKEKFGTGFLILCGLNVLAFAIYGVITAIDKSQPARFLFAIPLVFSLIEFIFLSDKKHWTVRTLRVLLILTPTWLAPLMLTTYWTRVLDIDGKFIEMVIIAVLFGLTYYLQNKNGKLESLFLAKDSYDARFYFKPYIDIFLQDLEQKIEKLQSLDLEIAMNILKKDINYWIEEFQKYTAHTIANGEIFFTTTLPSRKGISSIPTMSNAEVFFIEMAPFRKEILLDIRKRILDFYTENNLLTKEEYRPIRKYIEKTLKTIFYLPTNQTEIEELQKKVKEKEGRSKY